MYSPILGRETIYAVTDGGAPSLPDNGWKIDEVDNEWSAVRACLFPRDGLTTAWKCVRLIGGSWRKPIQDKYPTDWDAPLTREEQFLLLREHALSRSRLVQARDDLAEEDDLLAAATLDAVTERLLNDA